MKSHTLNNGRLTNEQGDLTERRQFLGQLASLGAATAIQTGHRGFAQPAASAGRPIQLVTAGKSPYTVVLPSKPGPAIQFAAEQLLGYIFRMSGCRMRRASLGEAVSGPAITLAPAEACPHAAQWIGKAADAAVIHRQGDNLYLTGKTSQGALFAVYELFANHPECFRVSSKGVRSPDGNVCTSSDETGRRVADNALAYVEQNPEIGTLHIWGADLPDGGWRQCDRCKTISVQDQYLRLCNRVAEALEKVRGDVEVCYIAYHDTLEPKITVKPHPKVAVEFAPRERCYAHAIDDPSCGENRNYRESLERNVESFQGRVHMFEYYGDSVLFGGIGAPLVDVIRKDMRYFENSEIAKISFLTFGRHSLWAYPANFFRFARCCWDREAGLDAVLAAYCRQTYGEHSPAMQSHFRVFEEAMRSVVTGGDIRFPGRRALKDYPGRRTSKDMAVIQQRRGQLAAAVRQLGRAEALIDKLDSTDARVRARIREQQDMVRYTHCRTKAILGEADALCAKGEEGAKLRQSAVQSLEEAARILEQVDDRVKGVWGKTRLKEYQDQDLRRIRR